MAKEKKKKQLTVDRLKGKIVVPDEIKEKSKHFAKMKSTIKAALKSGPKTIPEIASETRLPLGTVTYYVMSLNKFGEILAGNDNEDDYYSYHVPEKKQA